MINISNLLSEDPDTLEFSRKADGYLKVLKHSSPDAYPFTLEKIGFFIHSEPKTDHYSLVHDIPKLETYIKKKFSEKDPYVLDRNELEYAGRVWKFNKIISFWKYPSVQDFKKVISGLKLHGFHVDDSWQVQVFDKKNEEILIPVSQYAGEHQVSKNIDREHEKSPMLKKKDTSKNVSPELNLPKGMTQAKYNDIRRKRLGEDYLPDFRTHYFDE